MKAKTGTRQWADHNENCMDGCSNDCKYCYAKKIAIRFKRHTKESWHIMRASPKAAFVPRKHNGRVMFPTSHDLHFANRHIWLPFLKGLLEVGNDVLIVSKPEVAAINCIIGACMDYRDHIEFRFTIGSCNDYTLKYWEPGAPSFDERVTALSLAKNAGFRTSVSIEPMLDEDPSTLITLIRPFVTDTIWIGTMNNMKKSDFPPQEGLMYSQMLRINSLANITKVYQKFKDDPMIRWKDSIQKMMGLTIE